MSDTSRGDDTTPESMSARDARWWQQLDEYVAIREREGRDPSGAIPAEKKSYSWISDVRRREDSLTDDRRRALDERAPGWRTQDTNPDARWWQQLDEYVAIREREGRDPSGAIPTEKKSYSWISDVRRREDSLPDDRRRALDERAPGWRTPRTLADARWWQQLDEYVAIREREGRDPSVAIPAEKKSSVWISDVRRREDSLTDDRRRALDERAPGWQTPRTVVDAQWWQQLDEYVAIREREGRDPSGAIPTEKKSYSWISDVRRREDSLTDDRRRALDERAPGWYTPYTTLDARWWQQLDEYVAFREREGRDPSNEVSAEKALYHWIKGVRRRGNSLPDDRRRALDERSPGWQTPRTRADVQWWQQLDEYVAIREREGRDPSGAIPAEKKSYSWINNVRNREDSLPDDRRRALDERAPGWRTQRTALDVQWWQQLDEYVAIREREGRDPSGAIPAEKKSYSWINNVRNREDSLPDDRRRALDERAPGWRTQRNPRWVSRARLREIILAMKPHIGKASDVAQIIVMSKGYGIPQERLIPIVNTAMLPKFRDLAITEDDSQDEHDLIEGILDHAGAPTDLTEDDQPAAQEDDAQDTIVSDEALSTDVDDSVPEHPSGTDDDLVLEIGETVERAAQMLRLASAAGGNSSSDHDAVEFILSDTAAAILRPIYALDTSEQVAAAQERLAALRLDRAASEDIFMSDVLDRCIERLHCALAIDVPQHNLAPDTAARPNPVRVPMLMQRHAAAMLLNSETGSYGNWSGTGAGKTVSAILAARVTGIGQGQRQDILLVVCPKNVVSTWRAELTRTYTDWDIADGDNPWQPTWSGHGGPRVLIAPLSRFLDQHSAQRRQFLAQHDVGMLVVDEGHLAKQTGAVRATTDESVSQRRANLLDTASTIRTGNAKALIYPMTATPYVVSLNEPVSILRIMHPHSGKYTSSALGVDERKQQMSALNLNVQMTLNGVRHLPKYRNSFHEHTPTVHDQSVLRPLWEAINLHDSSPVAIDAAEAAPRNDLTVQACLDARDRGSKTVIYLRWTKPEIVGPLVQALEDVGLRVGQYNGQTKRDLTTFIGRRSVAGSDQGASVPASERIDVLIASSAVSVGIDGIQSVCDTLVLWTVPYTSAEYDQVVGRVMRTGQKSEAVHVVVPMVTVTDAHQTEHCYQRARLRAVTRRRDIGRIVNDGKIARDAAFTSEKALVRACTTWAQGAQYEDIAPDEVPVTDVPQAEDPTLREARRRGTTARATSRFHSQMNGHSTSENHARLTADRDLAVRYHDDLDEQRQRWECDPARDYAAVLLADRGRFPNAAKVADLGCGTGVLARALTGTSHEISEFDHVAVGPERGVIECDVTNLDMVPSHSLDVAVLMLAVMATNTGDYLREANRVLRGNGTLLMAEPTTRFDGITHDQIEQTLRAYGFEIAHHRDGRSIETMGNFTCIEATRRGDVAEGDLPALLGGTQGR